MAPATRSTGNLDGLPTSQAELERIIADRVAIAVAEMETNRTRHSGGQGGSGGNGGSDRRERSHTGKQLQ